MATTKTKTNINPDLLAHFVDQGIKQFVAKRYEAFIKDLEKDMAKELSGIVLYVMENVELQKAENSLIIILKTDHGNKNR